MKIAIIGSGFTGLTAAYLLAANHQVVVFEKEEKPGGLASSFKMEGWDWELEEYYHHFFASDREVLKLSGKLGIKDKLSFRPSKTSLFLDGKIFRFDNPQSLLSFPHLNPIDKFRIALGSVFLKVNPFWKPLENLPATSFIKKTMGEKVYRLVWKPLLTLKFGSSASKIPASWFWTRIKKRSFKLGYFEGGTNTLLKALTKALRQNDVRILTNKEVSLVKKNNRFFEVYTDKMSPQKFDCVIATVSPHILEKIFPQLEEKDKLKNFQSLGSLCLVLSLGESFLKDGTYWLNINNEEFPFVAVVEHTNFIDKKHYDNQNILYVGGYYPANHRFFRMTKEQIYREFLPYLQKINPVFDFRSNFLNFKLFKDSYSQPVVHLRHSEQLPKITTSIPGLYWASLHHVYPQDRGINYAISLGEKVAKDVEKNQF